MNKSSNYDDSQGTPYMYSHNSASGSFDPENIETGHTVSSDRETGIEFVREIIPQPAGQVGADGPLPPTEIIIVGTAHVSEKSVREVNDTISRVKPDIVAVELCRARYESIKGNVQNAQIPVKELLKGGKIYFYIVHMLLAHIQKKFADQMGIQPGAEMIGAIEAAEASGAQVLLIDRNVQVTLQRFWSKMGFIEKIKMMGGLLAAVLGIGGTKNIDMDTITNQDIVSVLVEEFRGSSPNAVKVLIDERDAYMARNLLRAAGTGGKKIVAVVGAGHRAGIQRYLENPASLPKVEYDVEAPKKRFSLAKLLGFAIVGIAIATFILLLLSGVPFETMMVAFAWWFIINGVLSAAGALLARGHPYSVLTAFSVAWLTSLNPMMAAGWFAGLTEAKYRNPTTDDFKTLIDADSTSEMMSNNLFRVILVAALANLGSMAGTFLGVYVMLEVTGIDPKAMIQAGISAGLTALGLG
ncbi:TraB/GumN family protein [Methanolobus chelungpuianus]|uniref:Conjugal transfer protein TraB n=1 Tax=Methanolobus chelungpuianus TaxID=502115 RepID=A0AAE3HC14_9EURY|nr:TraB/GumN family protein [Methanolobus chelungpuianus]MCQ6963825.1 conjugal transfer protein TraB [Methanolobus chelungpuianus]